MNNLTADGSEDQRAVPKMGSAGVSLTARDTLKRCGMSDICPENPMCTDFASAESLFSLHSGISIHSIQNNVVYAPNYASSGCGNITIEQVKGSVRRASQSERKSEESAYFVRSD